MLPALLARIARRRGWPQERKKVRCAYALPLRPHLSTHKLCAPPFHSQSITGSLAVGVAIQYCSSRVLAQDHHKTLSEIEPRGRIYCCEALPSSRGGMPQASSLPVVNLQRDDFWSHSVLFLHPSPSRSHPTVFLVTPSRAPTPIQTMSS